MENFDLKKYLAEGKLLKEEVDVLGNEFTQEIQDDMKMYYKMDVDMDDIKDWVNMYYIGYNSEYDEGPGDVDYEGNEFGSEDYESEKKELVFDTAEREDFYMHLNPEADSTFPNLAEGKILNESAPGYDTRKQGEALPTLESVKAAYEAKNDIKENKYDIEDPESPMYALEDNDQDVAILNNMTKKYGKDVVLMWLSSGEYGDQEYFEESVIKEK